MRKASICITVLAAMICVGAWAGQGKEKGNIPLNPPSKGAVKPVRGFDAAVEQVCVTVQNTLDTMATTKAQRLGAEAALTLVRAAAAQYQY